MSSRRSGSVAAILLSAFALPTVVHAEDVRKPFNVPAGPAANAVAEFAKQAKLNVLASADTLAGIITNEVRGKYSVEQALDKLLSGTGLVSKLSDGGSVFISMGASAGARPGATGIGQDIQHQPSCCGDTSAPSLSEPSVIVISGTRESVATAIEHKKNASTVTDAIVAEDVDQFPDKNIGEALSRITGVQISREFGEGNQISIRGVQPDLNRIEIDGMSLLSTAESGTRAPELRELPSELIKSIDVIKGVTADTTEGGLGGTVIIRTHRPLDFKRLTIAANLAAEQNSLRGGKQPRSSLLIADRFFDGRLGLMANLVHDKVLTEGDRLRNSGWRFIRDWDMSPERTVISTNPTAAAVTAKAGCAALGGTDRSDCERQWYDYSPATPRYGIWTRDHARDARQFTAQYALTTGLSAWVSFQQVNQDSWFNDRNFQTDFSSADRLADTGTLPKYNASGVPSGGSCLTPDTGSTPAGMVVINHQVTQYVVGNCLASSGRGGNAAFSTQARDFNQRVNAYYRSAGFDLRTGRWEAEGMLGKSDAFYQNDSNFVGLTMNAPGLVVSMDGKGFPHFAFPADWDPNNPASYIKAQFNFDPEELDSWENQAKLDLRYRPDIPGIKRISFGAQARSSGSVRYADGGYTMDSGSNLSSSSDDLGVQSPNIRYTWNYDPLNTTSVLRRPTAQTFVHSNDSEIWVSSQQMQQLVAAIRTNGPQFLKGAGLGGYPSSWMTPSYDAAAQFFDTSKFNHDLVRQAPGSDGNIYPQIPSYGVEERIRAAYLRLDFEERLWGHLVEGNAGLRYAETRVRSTGRERLFQRVERSAGSADYVDYLLGDNIVFRDNRYHDFLPSFNAAVWLQPTALVLRIGYGKVMARPSLNRLNPNIVCTLDSGKPQFGGNGYDACTAGNPYLQPYRAFDKDLSLEWYPRRGTQLSLAYFRKNIQTAILDNVTVRTDLLESGRQVDVSTTVNYGGATTNGVELAGRTALRFLPGFLSGLGVDANYTRMGYTYAAGTQMISALDGTVLPFPGMSRSAYNLSLWYDKGSINARFAYDHRAGYYTGSNDANTGNPIFAEPTGFLDAKLQYRINRRMSLSFEAKNLTNEVTLTTAGARSRPNDLTWSGRRYFINLGYKF